VDPAVGVEEAEVLECIMEELCVAEIEGERPVRVKLMKDRKDRKEIVSFKPQFNTKLQYNTENRIRLQLGNTPSSS
jgi:hypothetical protein